MVTEVSCNVCNKKFNRKYNLKCHYRIHTNVRPYTCDVPGCDKSFRWKSSLNHHKKSLKHNPGNRPKGRSKRNPRNAFDGNHHNRKHGGASGQKQSRRKVNVSEVDEDQSQVYIPEIHSPVAVTSLRESYDSVPSTLQHPDMVRMPPFAFAQYSHVPSPYYAEADLMARGDMRPEYNALYPYNLTMKVGAVALNDRSEFEDDLVKGFTVNADVRHLQNDTETSRNMLETEFNKELDDAIAYC